MPVFDAVFVHVLVALGTGVCERGGVPAGVPALLLDGELAGEDVTTGDDVTVGGKVPAGEKVAAGDDVSTGVAVTAGDCVAAGDGEMTGDVVLTGDAVLAEDGVTAGDMVATGLADDVELGAPVPLLDGVPDGLGVDDFRTATLRLEMVALDTPASLDSQE